jgi:dipeptidase E
MSIILASEARALLPEIQVFINRNLSASRIAVVRTAVNGECGDTSWFDLDRECWTHAGANLSEIELEEQDEASLRLFLKQYGILYVAGGHTHYLLHHAIRSGFKKAIGEFLAEGKIYIGTCAGSMIMGPHIRQVHNMECRYAFEVKYEGLGFIKECIVPHLNWEEEGGALAAYHKRLFGDWRQSGYPIRPLRDGQALCFKKGVYTIIERSVKV